MRAITSPIATRGSCDAPPKPLQGVRAVPAGVTLAAMAVTRPSPSVPSPPDRAPVPVASRRFPASDRADGRTVSGPVRSGRRTKLLVKHLVRGDIALIDHEDIDRVSAEELIAAGVVAVLNCGASSSGS